MEKSECTFEGVNSLTMGTLVGYAPGDEATSFIAPLAKIISRVFSGTSELA